MSADNSAASNAGAVPGPVPATPNRHTTAATPSQGTVSAPTPTFSKIIVAVHGVGDQFGGTTVRSVATRFATEESIIGKARPLPLSPQPLGHFYVPPQGSVTVAPLDLYDATVPSWAEFGFAEVYWADIPAEVIREGHTLEETKAWARTVVARAEAASSRNSAVGSRKRSASPDFDLAAETIDEMVDAVFVLENLLFLARKAGLVRFKLRELLDNYVGDVQLVADFPQTRGKIVATFERAMTELHSAHSAAEIYIVAHSEGTVVSFLALLKAICQRESDAPLWLSNVKGFMTIGSPIDKHLLLWKGMWAGLDPHAPDTYSQNHPGQICWCNYYDYGDPIGFELDTARAFLYRNGKQTSFDFPKKNDIGFARYMMPGKAHNDYWDDAEVFRHFIGKAVLHRHLREERLPPSDPFVYVLSPVLPYVFSASLLFLGSYLVCKNMAQFNRHGDTLPGMKLLLMSAGASALVAGTTVFARLPRLAHGLLWRWIIPLAAFAAGALFYARAVPTDTKERLATAFAWLPNPIPSTAWAQAAQPVPEPLKALFSWLRLDWATDVLILAALIVGLIGRAPTSRRLFRAGNRRRRIILRGMRPFMLTGAFTTLAVVMTQIWHSQRAGDIGDERMALWPALLATAAFLYLWWLAALVFDLAFVWQRYIRNSLMVRRFRKWSS